LSEDSETEYTTENSLFSAREVYFYKFLFQEILIFKKNNLYKKVTVINFNIFSKRILENIF